MPVPIVRGSLRLRLALWYGVVVIITAFTTLIVMRQGVQWALVHEIDEILMEDANEIDLALRETPTEDFSVVTHELERKAIGHRHHGWFAQLRNERGETIWATDEPHSALRISMERLNKPITVASGDRIYSRRISANPHGVASIVVGEHLHLLQNEISRIDRLVIATAGCVLVVAPLCAYWLAGRAANVVGEITQAGSRLRPDHLDERLPIQGTGDELDRLAQTINGLLDRIAVFLDQKRDVLANAAHELRTPLAAIRSSAEVALNENRTAREYEELLEDIISESTSLEMLLKQLLLLSETEAERLKTQVESVALDELVSKSVSMFRGVSESREVSLHITRLDPAKAPGNRLHLWEVVNNLVDNALKYTSAGGSVEISLAMETHKVRFSVRDTGIGIAKDDLPRVFERFFRGDRSRARGGVGLGLSICKEVVEAHGGTIRCTSELGKGSEFVVELPTRE